ncbi:MAG: DUF4124 domain-containing protein [Betaproteobacteria bacterium]|nr:DUF4124 domain-containing protein [Betaproteobacteria bacterium]
MRSRNLLLLLVLAAPYAHAQIWECIDPQSGAKELNNDPASAKNKNCVRKNIGPINTVPAPRPPQQPAQKSANFPSVDGDTQKQRDAERRQILERELAQEQRSLETARKQLAEQKEIRLGSEKNFARVEERLKPYEDRVRQHQNNIESLKKELANAR